MRAHSRGDQQANTRIGAVIVECSPIEVRAEHHYLGRPQIDMGVESDLRLI